jgi:2-ketocyclohexanecarboxyl-CoA hydrolase
MPVEAHASDRQCDDGFAPDPRRRPVPEDLTNLTDVTYEVERGLATITISRPRRMNSFRAQTIDELNMCLRAAWASGDVGVVCLTGAGDRAFCTGGDQKQRQETGDYGPSRSGLFEIDTFQRGLRDIPKPVIAAVNGYAVGGGHVIHVLCDLSIASETAVFGQVGPRVGSFDAGFGTGYLARVIGEKRAREIWFLCRQYSAQQAYDWGLVNKVVPQADLMAEVRSWADEILQLSPTSLKLLKQSFNTDTEHFAALTQMAASSLAMFTDTIEAKEGINAFNEKRSPDFSPYRGAH